MIMITYDYPLVTWQWEIPFWKWSQKEDQPVTSCHLMEIWYGNGWLSKSTWRFQWPIWGCQSKCFRMISWNNMAHPNLKRMITFGVALWLRFHLHMFPREFLGDDRIRSTLLAWTEGNRDEPTHRQTRFRKRHATGECWNLSEKTTQKDSISTAKGIQKPHVFNIYDVFGAKIIFI